ncbi:MAG TPA: hypothetical protein VHV78_02150 [Gemmatimonadaceae bacterium]|nr:hypothetical protein [Gemmatimonadaceae bacterium]
MANAIRFADLKSLGKADREHAIGVLVSEAKAPVNGQAFVIRAKIQGFESRYEMTSAQLRDGLRTNKIRETAEVSDWLFWLRVRDACGG